MRSISLKSHFDASLECEVTVLSKLISKKRVCKSIDIQKNTNLNASQLHYQLSHMAVVFDGMLLKFSPILRLQPAAERNLITAFTHGDKLEVGG